VIIETLPEPQWTDDQIRDEDRPFWRISGRWKMASGQRRRREANEAKRRRPERERRKQLRTPPPPYED
jgi:hypothetical protein